MSEVQVFPRICRTMPIRWLDEVSRFQGFKSLEDDLRSTFQYEIKYSTVFQGYLDIQNLGLGSKDPNMSNDIP